MKIEMQDALWFRLDESQRYDVLQKMEFYGGGFASALAKAWQRADASNSAKLGEAFDELVRAYAKGGY